MVVYYVTINHASSLTCIGASNYKGQILFTGEGQGEKIPGTLYLMNPEEPYNTTGADSLTSLTRLQTDNIPALVNNYFGRQFNSLNDVAVHPRTGEIYFTDTQYGHFNNFRPAPGLPNQVYRFNDETGALAVVADEFDVPNGINSLLHVETFELIVYRNWILS